MPAILASFVCGLVFGAGLLISGMTQPEKVLGFLDLFGALGRHARLRHGRRGCRLCDRLRAGPPPRRALFAAKFSWPDARDIDAPLVAGAALFGIGWGLVGICPGPALVNLAGLSLPIVVFVAAMVIGMLGYELWQRQGVAKGAPQSPLAATPSDG